MTPARAAKSNHVFHQYTLILEGLDRDALNSYLAARNIPSMIYYPVPAHKQKMFDAADAQTFRLPATDLLSEKVISLPMHTELKEDHLDYIISKVSDFLN